MKNKNKNKNREIENQKFSLNNSKLRVLLLAISVMTTSCATHQGHFGIGNPRVLNPEQAEYSLDAQKKVVTDKTMLENISPFAISQEHTRSSDISQRGKIHIIPGGPANAIPATPAVPATATTPTVPVIPGKPAVPSPDVGKVTQSNLPLIVLTLGANAQFNGLMMDGFTSLESYSAHKINLEENFEIKTMGLGEHGEIFKIKFDIWVDPVRQDYLSYSWRWIEAIFAEHGFRNYTKDYHVETHFTILKDSAEVVLVQPVHEGIGSIETTVIQKTSQLAGGGTWQGIAAEIDLAERHREQFKEQRKNPILRGIVDSKSTFHFVVSPRQHVAQRTFRIPFFMSRYSIERGLESGPYPVSAYILIKDKNVVELPIKVCGNYKQFGNAHLSGQNDPINFGRTQANCIEKNIKLMRGT